MLKLRLLGNPEINLGGEAVAGALSHKAQALLYYLAATGQSQARATLAALLWGDMPDTSARTNLRKALANLRRPLEEYLDIDRQSVAIKSGIDLQVDVAEFETMVISALSEGMLKESKVSSLEGAVKLYGGDFLSGFHVLRAPDFESWQASERSRHRELVVQALQALVDHHVDQGDLSKGIFYSRQLINIEPWREEAHRRLMLLLAMDGQRSAALAQYETCCKMLEEELGVEPGEETRTLYEDIRDEKWRKQIGPISGHDADPSPKSFPSSTPILTAVSFNLPAQSTSFVGREKEVAEIQRILAEEEACRMMTLIGQGGIGKTRLSLAVASAMADRFKHGVYFVPLAPVNQPEFIVSAVAEALEFNVSGSGEPEKDQLLNFLSHRNLLLVLDNFEHLIPSPRFETKHGLQTKEEQINSIDLILEIFSIAPEVTFLITSRERLNLQEEWVYEVPGMEYPHLDEEAWLGAEPQDSLLKKFSAMQLFFERARRVDARFKLSTDEFPHIVHICRLLGGMPLGLELAAAWVRSMSCQEIAQEIEQNLDFLSSKMRNIPARHRSLRAVFDQTWEQLTEEEQLVLSKLSIFKGGCQRQAAKFITGASLPILAELVDRALLRRSAAGRFTMHELLRQYAAQKLQDPIGLTIETEAVHAHYYAAFLQERTADLMSSRQAEALGEIATEIDNVRAGWSWAVEARNFALISRAADGLYFYCEMQGQPQVGMNAFHRAAKALREKGSLQDDASDPEHKLLLGHLIGRQGFLANRSGLFAESLDLMRESVSLLRQVGPDGRRQLAISLKFLGEETYFQGNPEEAVALLNESVQLASEVGDLWILGGAWQNLGQTAEFQGEYAQAVPYFQKSLKVLEQIGELRTRSFALNNWGRSCYAMGEYAQSQKLLHEALNIRQTSGDLTGIAYSLLDLGKLACLLGQYAEAQEFVQQAKVLSEEIGDSDQVARCQNGLGMVLRQIGDLDGAEACHQASLRTYNQLGISRAIPFTLNNLGHVAFDRGAYQQAQHKFHESLQVAQALHNTGEQASTLRHLGHVAVVLGHESDVRDNFQKALEIVTKTGAAPLALDVMLGWAVFLMDADSTAARLTFVINHPAAAYETKNKARQRLIEFKSTSPGVESSRSIGKIASDWRILAAKMVSEMSGVV